jgi:pimeloyl-ACP methyl ester carboxylesterase
MATLKLSPHGSRLHYLTRGRGEPTLLIHGLGSNGADWALQAAALEPRFRLIVPDLPGSGYSEPPGKYCIAEIARLLWALLDHLKIQRLNIIGFSLGGAVALEMALQRPGCVIRLGLINSLASYRIDHWRKWLEAWVPAILIPLFGMRANAWLVASRLFPQPWQQALRERAAAVVRAVSGREYLGLGMALTRWSAIDRLERLHARSLIIAAEHDYTPLAEKRKMAAAMRADLVVVRGSRHGTPFDASQAVNACLLALLTDQPLPPEERWVCDGAPALPGLPFAGTIAEEHALGP